jgi:DNA ligase-1
MREVKRICEQLQATNGKKDKECILTNNKDNVLLQKVLQFVYSPHIISGLSDKKINKQVTNGADRTFNSLIEAMEYLKTNNTGTDEVIGNIRHYISCQDYDLQDFIKQILTKSLKVGADSKTFNKIWGKDFIPEWEVQQAYSIEKYKLKPNEWFALSEKLNGNRGTYIDEKILSRQGKEFAGLEHIIEDIDRIGLSNMVVDGELRRKNTDGLCDNENFTVGTGILNSDSGDKSQIEFIIFDVISKDEMAAGESKDKYKTRMKQIESIKTKIEELGLQNLKVVEIYYSGTDQSMIDKYLDKAVTEDKEGLMLNRDIPYKCKRHNGILKVKRFYTMDLEVVDYEEGSGRLKGTLGALVVDFKGNKVNVGSGYDDVTRREIWSNRDEIIGRIIEVKYKEISKDKKTGLESLQFPIFVCIREKGKKVSYD